MQPLPIHAVHHISLQTKRLAESRKFYCEIMGFREIQRPNFTFAGAWLYNYDWGLVNAALRYVGLADWQRSWLGEPATALGALIVVDIWKWTGFHLIVCLAAIHGLPKEILESAEMDNCGWARKLCFIVIPMLAGTLGGLLVLGFIGKMKVFDLVWIMTHGGPLWSTETVSTYVYKRAFDWVTFDLGYPSAIAVVWFAAILAFVLVPRLFLRTRDKLEY